MTDDTEQTLDDLLRECKHAAFRDACYVVRDSMFMAERMLINRGDVDPRRQDVLDVARMIVDASNTRLAIGLEEWIVTVTDSSTLQ